MAGANKHACNVTGSARIARAKLNSADPCSGGDASAGKLRRRKTNMYWKARFLVIWQLLGTNPDIKYITMVAGGR
jgi:hypothetical protein